MKKILCTFIGMALISISSCVNKKVESIELPKMAEESVVADFVQSRKSCNAMYHWKAEFNPTDEEKAMMKRHDVRKLYVKMFDVVYDPYIDCELVPIATTKFKQKPQEGVAIVPCVYITVDAMRNIPNDQVCGKYSDLIIARVLNMVDYNELGDVNEIQFDCDWTASTRDNFFALCRKAKTVLEKKGIALSVTIRLHQLSQASPPAHCGMLMLYNTGALKSSKTRNSILSYDDVKLYLKNTKSYDLPLDFAYPAFSWNVWFRGDEFQALISDVDISNTNLYKNLRDNIYEVQKDHNCSGQQLKKGDILRHETSDIGEVLEVKYDVERKLKDKESSVAIYHLSSKDIKKISEDEIGEIYNK